MNLLLAQLTNAMETLVHVLDMIEIGSVDTMAQYIPLERCICVMTKLPSQPALYCCCVHVRPESHLEVSEVTAQWREIETG